TSPNFTYPPPARPAGLATKHLPTNRTPPAQTLADPRCSAGNGFPSVTNCAKAQGSGKQGWTSNERSLRSRRIFAANANRTNANRLLFANSVRERPPYSHIAYANDLLFVRL